MDVDAVEIRVLGCLIEKQRTTPDTYPLSLNSLRLACNQSTNRDPVVDYDEPTIRAALDRLSRRAVGAARERRGQPRGQVPPPAGRGARASGRQLSILAVLMLRGPQTPGELKTRTERLHRFESTAEVIEVLQELIDRELAARQARRPGQKEERYEQLLGADAVEAPAEAEEESRLDGLERRVERLEDELASIRDTLGPA